MKAGSRIELIMSAMLLLVTQVSHAEFHLWTINEILGNGVGSMQFVELTTTASGQGLLSGHTLVASDGGQSQNSVTFTQDLLGETANKTLLIATAQFTSVTGLQADVVIPANFLFTTGGNLNFAEGASEVSYTRSQLPRNGIQSLSASLQPVTASPKSFAGLGASLSTDPGASFDANNSVMNLPVLNAPGIGVANVSFAVDLQTLVFTLLNDFFLYDVGITAGNKPAEFTGSVLYIPGLVVGNDIYEFNLTIQGDNPITFANPDVISVSAVPPSPAPAPTPDPLQESIARGQSQYSQQACGACHGPTGGGGSAPGLRNIPQSGFAALRATINNTMPQASPGSCVDNSASSCATDIANYIINIFK